MAELFTSIIGSHAGGIAERGRLDRTEMIRRYRLHAQRLLLEATAILDLPDDEFEVRQHRGVYRLRDVVDLLPDGSAVRRG